MDVPTPRGSVAPQATGVKSDFAQAVNQRVALPPLDDAFQKLLLPVRKSLARIESQLEATSTPPGSLAAGLARGNAEAKQDPAAEQPVVMAKEAMIADGGLLAGLLRRFDQVSTELTDLRREAITLIELNAAATELTPEVLVGEPRSSNALIYESWEEIILGSELCGNSSLNTVRSQFLEDIVSGLVSARALAGQLLLLQATAVNELPERFRHVGESYYRWRPRSSTADEPFERSLADWLTRRAETAGLRNSIQLVHPGDRFDSTRHSATTRGVEVVAVHGWIVLRDNQKVYTKASVTVQ